jgi:hypothetical protein
MQRVATVMARSTLMPESLWMEGKKDDKQPLPYEQILSNCFLVVNQAVRWGLDPFAVAQCVSVVHGKLCYEGKLVSAVLQAKMGISLSHVIVGEGEATRIYLSDRVITEDVRKALYPGCRREDMRLFDGSVAEWKTGGANSPWSPKNFARMLIYRGTRDWCRIYEPALMLGVYTDDEMEDLDASVRSRGARNITPSNVIADPLSDEPIAAPQKIKPSEPVEFDEPVDKKETVDPDTGELTPNTNPDEDASSVGDDESVTTTSASSTEPDQTVSPDPAPTAEPATSPTDAPASSAGSAPSKFTFGADERLHLIDFARKSLDDAASDQDEAAKLYAIDRMRLNYLDAVESADARKAIEAMDKALTAVAKRQRTREQATAYIATEILGCGASDLEGRRNG